MGLELRVMLKVVIAALKAKASRRLESRGQRLTSRTTSLAAVGVQGVETSTRVSCCDEPRLEAKILASAS